MKTLLSLPQHLVEAFFDISGYSPQHFFCTSDPCDKKLGSGGGTIWLLANAWRKQCEENACELSFEEWLQNDKRILIHAGGQSRRLPAYAPFGKVLTPIPVFRWARGARFDQTLLSLQLPLYEEILGKTNEQVHTLVASGDVYLRKVGVLGEIPEADVVCYGLWASPEQMSRHGVFCVSRNGLGQLDFMLQKPSVETIASIMQTHYVLMDVGVWLLSDKAIKRLQHQTSVAGIAGVNADDYSAYDLYSQFGCALGEHPSKVDVDLSGLTVAIVPFEGEFYHFGTSPELVSSMMQLQNLVQDQRQILQRGIKAHPSLFTQNSVIANHLNEENAFVWVENSILGEKWHLTQENIVTGVPENNWSVTLPKGICLDFVAVGDDAFALRLYGYHDSFRGCIKEGDVKFMGERLQDWCQKRKICFSEETDIQDLPLFPVSNDLDLLDKLFRFMLFGEGDSCLYNNACRLSAEQLSQQANLMRTVNQRVRIRRKNLVAIAQNWRKSLFYQLNLRYVADEWRVLGELPEALPESTSTLIKMHDAMFRSECLRLKGEAAHEKYAAEAFELLRNDIIEYAKQHKVEPHTDAFSDQIVWARSGARVDLAGGWTDTPPYSMMAGGKVINLSINLNGQQPLQVYVRGAKHYHIVCRSIDMGAEENIFTYEELENYGKVGSPFSIPKAALALCGFLPMFSAVRHRSLKEQLLSMGGGIEITLLSAIPSGSGLGTSSILGATLLGALNDYCCLNWDKQEISNRTLLLEQLLTTGGGWQDQFGGAFPGLKLLESNPGIHQHIVCRQLPTLLFTHPEFSACHLLYYTGITRTAKNILVDIVRGMFLNDERLTLLTKMKEHTLQMYEAIQCNDFATYGRLVKKSWEQNKQLDAGTSTAEIERICGLVDDLCHGYKLPGAGGGGFMYMVAKDADAAARIRRLLTENKKHENARFVELSLCHRGLEVSRS